MERRKRIIYKIIDIVEDDEYDFTNEYDDPDYERFPVCEVCNDQYIICDCDGLKDTR